MAIIVPPRRPCAALTLILALAGLAEATAARSAFLEAAFFEATLAYPSFFEAALLGPEAIGTGFTIGESSVVKARADGYEARVYRVNGGGHDWFGTWGNMDITSAVEMWNFWSQFCGTTASVSAPDLQKELVQWNGDRFTALENCRIRLFETSGKVVLDRPMQAGQSIDFNGCNQVYLMNAHQGGGAFQQLKFWAE